MSVARSSAFVDQPTTSVILTPDVNQTLAVVALSQNHPAAKMAGASASDTLDTTNLGQTLVHVVKLHPKT